jgi:hypothetical protein
MSYEQWGPLGGLVGTWQGDQGLDVSFHNDKGKIQETPFHERTSFRPFGPVENGPQILFGLDYRTAACRFGEQTPFHTELGYWMWDGANRQVMRCFTVPRGFTVIAGGTVEPGATKFKLEAELGSTSYGMLSNRYLDEVARSTRFDVVVTIDGDTFSYDETTVVEHQRTNGIVLHTDRNTLKRLSWEA